MLRCTAVMSCVPSESKVRVMLALPFSPTGTGIPQSVSPSLNRTMPPQGSGTPCASKLTSAPVCALDGPVSTVAVSASGTGETCTVCTPTANPPPREVARYFADSCRHVFPLDDEACLVALGLPRVQLTPGVDVQSTSRAWLRAPYSRTYVSLDDPESMINAIARVNAPSATPLYSADASWFCSLCRASRTTSNTDCLSVTETTSSSHHRPFVRTSSTR